MFYEIQRPGTRLVFIISFFFEQDPEDVLQVLGTLVYGLLP